MQVDDESGFISFFNRLPSTDAIRLFERNDFYTVHGPDAVYVATTVYKTTSVIRQLGSARNGLQSCTLSVTAFRNFLREVLFVQGKRVEIWQQKGRGSWEVGKTASPGNLQDVEEDLGSSGDAAPVIVAVKVQAKGEDRSVGVCFADASVRELGIAEFADNEVYSNLEVRAPLRRASREEGVLTESRVSLSSSARKNVYSRWIRIRRTWSSRKFAN